MRKIIKPGEKLFVYCCPFCGQVEALSQAEATVCPNCQTDMTLAEKLTEKDIKPKAPAEKQKIRISKEQNVVIEVGKLLEPVHLETPSAPAPRSLVTPVSKRKGRPPKKVLPTPATGEDNCGNCAKALTTQKGFTCKETCEAVTSKEWCPNHKKGTPVE